MCTCSTACQQVDELLFCKMCMGDTSSMQCYVDPASCLLSIIAHGYIPAASGTKPFRQRKAATEGPLQAMMGCTQLHVYEGAFAMPTGANIHPRRVVHWRIFGCYTSPDRNADRQSSPRRISFKHPLHDCWDYRRVAGCHHHTAI